MKLVKHERNGDEARDDWETPRYIFDQINSIVKFDCDVAANAKNALCKKWFGPGSPYGEDALAESKWGKRNWLNPPYILWGDFAEKSYVHTYTGEETWLLVPPRTGTKNFQKYMSLASEHIFIEGRLQFTLDGKRPTRVNKAGKEVKSGNGADSMIAVFRPRLKHAVYGNPAQVYWSPKNLDQEGEG